MRRRIAVLGISGVGKSTLITKIRETIPLIHLQASGLIKAEQAHRAQNPDSSETLRNGAVIDNQALMIAAFKREAAESELPIIFDGHSVIDGRGGLIEIPSSVFGELELDAICFLAADPDAIAERRRADIERERPIHNAAILQDHQKIAESAARRIASEIKCSFISVTESEISLLRELLVIR